MASFPKLLIDGSSLIGVRQGRPCNRLPDAMLFGRDMLLLLLLSLSGSSAYWACWAAGAAGQGGWACIQPRTLICSTVQNLSANFGLPGTPATRTREATCKSLVSSRFAYCSSSFLIHSSRFYPRPLGCFSSRCELQPQRPHHHNLIHFSHIVEIPLIRYATAEYAWIRSHEQHC